jgi:hypothetical protein
VRSLALPLNACGAAVAAVALLLGVAIARVHAGGLELAQSIGEPLIAYSGATHEEGLRTLVVNGARFRMRTGSTLDSIDAVIDAHAAPCRSGVLTPDPVVRTRRAAQGFIGCIVPTDAPLLERVQALHETQDFAALGELRFAWAMQTPTGTRYVAIAAEGELNVPAMFPADSDAPGIDLPGLPRPPSARRLLTTWQEGQDPVLVSYLSELALTEVINRYTSALAAAGLDVERVPTRVDGEQTFLVRNGARQHLAVLAEDDGGTLISLIPIGDDATELAGVR